MCRKNLPKFVIFKSKDSIIHTKETIPYTLYKYKITKLTRIFLLCFRYVVKCFYTSDVSLK